MTDHDFRAADLRAVLAEGNRLHDARHQAMAVDDTFATVSGRWRDDVLELLERMAEIVRTPLPEDFPAVDPVPDTAPDLAAQVAALTERVAAVEQQARITASSLTGAWVDITAAHAHLNENAERIDVLEERDVNRLWADMVERRAAAATADSEPCDVPWCDVASHVPRTMTNAPAAAPAAPVDPEPDRYTYDVAPDGEGWIILDGGNDAEMWAQDITDAQRLCRLLNAAPVDPWGPPRPMSDLPDDHDEVLIGHTEGSVVAREQTRRATDTYAGRVCWWPLPSVPAELREAQP